jgi:hypothetical protein
MAVEMTAMNGVQKSFRIGLSFLDILSLARRGVKERRGKLL